MRALTAPQLMELWERGLRRPAVERALLLLEAACPDMTREKLAALSLGQRDVLLFELREHTLGDTLKGTTECAHCGERLEFTLDTTQLVPRETPFSAEPSPVPSMFEFSEDGFLVIFRALNTADLAAAARTRDSRAARLVLAARCVAEAKRAHSRVAVEDLPDEVLGRLSRHLAECDPAAEILLDLRCPACSRQSEPLFDIASFFWTEITSLAERLLREVHVLARAYGWRELDILSMSAARRHYYLDLVS